jgi:Fibronectin type III domain
VPTGGSSSTATPFGGSSVISPVRRRGRPDSSQRGSVAYASTAEALAVLGGGLAYHVYANTGAGDPIDYATPIAAVSGTAWTSGTLAAPGTWSFGVRAFDGNGEEQNLDCAVVIVLDGNGNDITNRPAPPVGLRAFATAGSSIRVEWFYPPTNGSKAPTGFDVYCTAGPISYSSTAATVAFNAGVLSTFVTNISGLTGGTTYSIGVRAYNASGAETNTVVISVVADATGPAAVDSLVATAIV